MKGSRGHALPKSVLMGSERVCFGREELYKQQQQQSCQAPPTSRARDISPSVGPSILGGGGSYPSTSTFIQRSIKEATFVLNSYYRASIPAPAGNNNYFKINLEGDDPLPISHVPVRTYYSLILGPLESRRSLG